MTTRPAHPLRRAAPLRLLASPGWFLLVTVAVALLTAAVAAPVLFLRAASDAAMKGELAAVEQDAFASTSSGVRGAWSGILKPPEQQTVLGALNRLPGFTPPRLQAVGIKAGVTPGTRGMVGSPGREAASALYYRDGAIEALDPDGKAPSGVWLDRDVAAELGVKPGDTVRLWIEITKALGDPAEGKATVAGVFTRTPGSALPAAVAVNQQVAKRDLPWDPDRPASGTPIVVADQATFSRLIGQIRDIALWTADMDREPGMTPQETTNAARAVTRLRETAFDDTSQLAAATLTAKPLPDHLQVNSGLPDIVDRFQATAAAAEDQSSAFVSAGIVLGLVVVGAAGVLLGRSRRRELDLMTGLGMSPGEAGRLALAESLLPVAAGTVAGGVIAWVCVRAVGPPGRLEDGAVAETVRRAVVGGVAALVLLGLCAAATAWLVERRATGGMYAERRRIPWEPVLIVAAGLCGFSVINTGTGARPASPLSVVFPVLLSAVIAVVILWLLRFVASRGRGRAGTGSPRWLAVQRSRAGARETVAVALAVAVGLSVLGYALAVHRGVTEGVDDKVAAAVGAHTVVNVEDQLKRKISLSARTRDGLPKLPYPPMPASTVVWRMDVRLPPTFGDQPLLAVDRRTFASVADWGSTGKLGDARKALDLLGQKLENKFAVPVVIAGRTDMKVGDRGVINSLDEWMVPYEVVAVVEAFPGSESEPNDFTVYAGARQLFDEVPGLEPMVLTDPPSNGAGEFAAEIWSSRDSTNVAGFLAARGLEARDTRLREQAQASSTLVAAGWSAGYVVALGTGAMLLVGAAALLLAVRLADRDRVSDILLRRMGYSPRDLTAARTWEVAAVVASSLLAAVVAVGALTFSPSMIEPDISLLPRISPLPALLDLGVLLLVTGAMVLAAAAVARRRVSRAVPAEVLRGNG